MMPTPSHNRLVSVVLGEVQTIIAAMSLHTPPSWVYDKRSHDLGSMGAGAQPLLNSFLLLRGLLLQSEDEMDPIVFLKPFLEVCFEIFNSVKIFLRSSL
jgi:hypothetical protein